MRCIAMWTRSVATFFLAAWVALGLGLTQAAAEPGPAPDKRPNIVFIFTDDHAAHAIGAYGSKINTTPNLDRLAREGMLFENCFVTNSICAPSRAVIQTGKHSHLNGVPTNGPTFDGTQQTFPKLLKKAGYQTAVVGKWHLRSEPVGFDFWNVLIGQGPYYNPPLRTPEGVVKHTGYTTDIVTDIALDWLENGRDKSKPFMLMYQHKAPHRNWQPGPKHLTMYDDVTIPEPATLFDDWSNRASPARLQEMTVARHLSPGDLKLTPPGNLTPEQLAAWNKAYEPKNEAFRKANLTGRDRVRWMYQRYLKDYLRAIASVDDNVGRVLEYLEKTGLADNTVVIYNSDQGFYLGDHGWYDKRWMYEESLRMPLIVRWPGVAKPGSRNRDLVQNLDFAETFLDMAGAPVPDDMQGRSIVPLLKGQAPKDWRKSIYYHYYEFPSVHSVARHYGVRTQRHKLVYYYTFGEWELFDLEKDPAELRSVYDDPAYAGVVRELKAELERLRKLYRVEQYQEPPAPPAPKEIPLKLVLRYDFADADEKTVPDVSGGGHDGQVRNAKLSAGRRGGALELDGTASVALDPIPRSLDASWKPLTVGAWCKAGSGDGVLFAYGGKRCGFCLYLEEGRPHFVLRSAGVLCEAVGIQNVPMGEWVHLAGVADTDGRLHVLMDGKPVGESDAWQLISRFDARRPDAISVGADVGETVGDYPGALHFQGLIEDVRLYWGVLPEKQLGNWAAE